MPNVFSLTGGANANSIQNTLYNQPALSGSILNTLHCYCLFYLADALSTSTNAAAVAAQANALAPFINGLGGNLAALAGVSNSTSNLNVASSLNAANTLIQQQLTGLLSGSSVVLVSNLDENVSLFYVRLVISGK